MEDALHTYTVPTSWEIFRNMSRDDNIRILAENITPSSSEEGEHTKEGEKTNGEETQDIQSQKEQKEKGEMGQIAESKTKEETTAKTPRENRMRSRTEKAEKAQMKAATAKAVTQKQKEKTHPKISATHTETIDTGISIGSKEKEQQEKSPEILAREATTVLVALSTPTKQKEKGKRQTSMYFKARKSTRIQTSRIGGAVEGHGQEGVILWHT